MPGMNSGLGASNSTIVSAFLSALLHQGLVVLVILGLLAMAWNLLRARQMHRASIRPGVAPASPIVALPGPEPAARRVLRVGFGLIWLFDGILQGQSSMPLGMTTQVIQPTAVASPRWVQHLVNTGATIWNNHPITAATAAVWIQVGIGLWLVVAPRGLWSRAAGLVSAGWGTVVWIFGESFGGIFAPGLTWLFGAPGAVVFYAAAGLLVALPERSWSGGRLGRRILAAMGVFFVAMALLQAWPGRGFWQGRPPHRAGSGTLTGMVEEMSATPQPHLLSSWVASFGSFDASHGWAVNLFVVVALAVIGIALLTGRVSLLRAGVAAAAVVCLADWVLVEDFGFFGGVGTDPNSMIPMTLVLVAGYVAVTRVPVAPDNVVAFPRPPGSGPTWLERMNANPGYTFRILAALGALGITLLGVAPIAVASTNPNADPILAQAVDGIPDKTDIPAPKFQLVDQAGVPVSLAGLRGKTIALTFLDPVCVSDCPIIAQEFRGADRLLGSAARRVELIAVVANPLYRARVYTLAFDRSEDLDQVPNWEYLTGSLAQLTRVWSAFGVEVQYETGGAMIGHSDLAYVIDPTGHIRYQLNIDPGPATASTKSSFSVTLADAIRSVTG
jgi:cytochrome oxidase Cu insertion factor (SCO1/SenC/PrrC family)